MKKILVTYASNAGSTVKVAQAVADELAKTADVDVLPLEKVTSLDDYSAIVLGAPMIVGWHRGALAFLKRNQAALGQKPLAIFVTCVNLTKTDETNLEGVPLFIDEKLPKAPKNPARLSMKENYSTPKNYLTPILKLAKPVSIGIFGGSLQYFSMKWWQVPFVLLVIQAMPGDKRNWKAIQTWAGGLFQERVSNPEQKTL
jgi:menaquinone-dependent protoporphyrinogen IX oxidase